MPADRTHDEAEERKPKKPRTSTACNVCRRKRGKCDGLKPICTSCAATGTPCEYDLGGDKRKPYTKSVVSAMQARIESLEAEVERLSPMGGRSGVQSGAATGTHTPVGGESGPIPHFLDISGPSIVPKHTPLDAFQGGLALNAHSELRFYGPTSSYRAVLSDAVTSTPSSMDAIRTFSLTRAPIPTAIPTEPSLPRVPPELPPDFKARLLRLAFEFCFSQFNIVSEREFYADLQMYPYERTSFYSPFLLNLVLATGCRYLDPAEDYPKEIDGLWGDSDTRGDVFVNYARYLLDQEWYNPTLSTIRGLSVLGMYLAGRGFDGPCFMFVGLSMRLVEDFGLHLGIHRLSMGAGGIKDEVITSRRDTFWSTISSDVIASMYIGRKLYFSGPEEIDQIPPPVVPDLDFEAPMYRSSAFHWSSKLILLGARVMTSVYALKPGISLRARQAAVPELHLALESWYHELPSHLRASTSDASKAPHAHVIALNLVYNMMHIQLHRPFFRRVAKDAPNISTDKCLAAASSIVRLVKLQRNAHGLRFTTPSFQHAAFCAGTILALSANEDNISEPPTLDASRRSQAKTDLRLVIESLREAGLTWTTALTSANILEALLDQWEPSTEHAAADLSWAPQAFGADSSYTGAFPYIFPSWELDPSGQLDFLGGLLNPMPPEEHY